MAKAILEFDLTDFDDKRSFKRFAHSLDMAIFIWEIQHRLLIDIKEQKFTGKQISQRLQASLDDLKFDIEELGG